MTSEPIMTTITSTVDPEWIAFCMKETDLFSRSYCGYWLRGIERDDTRGWLAWEDDEQHHHGEEPERDVALAAWAAGGDLPKGYYRMDLDFAVRSWGEGVKKYGVEWFEHGDADTYDYVMQQALLGEQRYC